MDDAMSRVVIGMDPHKRSVTIEVMRSDERILGSGRYGTDRDGYRDLVPVAQQWPQRVWAIEGCNGIARHIALRLLADRRRALGEDHTRMISQLHQLLLELIPGGAKRDLSAAQARKLLATVRPRDVAGKARRRVAAELISDLERIHARKKAANKELADLLTATGTSLTALHGIGPSGAARLLVEVGDITRFPDHNHFASWTGTAPIDASSGDQVRHRLSRGGNRQINRVLHIMATVQLRNPTEGRAYYDRTKARGKTSNEAMRCLKRRLSDIVFRTMLNDAAHAVATSPGGQRGNDSDSSATGSQPHTGTSDKPLPGPVISQPRTLAPAMS